MARIGPALAVIAAATTRDERARAGGAPRAVRAPEQPRGRGRESAPCGCALIILNTRNRNSRLPTRRLGSQLFDSVQRGT